MADGLGDPAERERLLAGVDPDRAAEHHALLRDILRAEMRLWDGGHSAAAEYLAGCLAFDPDLEAWEQGRREYFGQE
jgi:hypothetical protein